MQCERCGSNHTIRVGKHLGKQRWRCKACDKRMTEGKRVRYPQSVKDKAIQLHLEGMGFRAIARIMGCSNVAVLKWVRQAANQLPKTELPEYVEVMEVDEMWHFVKKRRESCGYGWRMTVTPGGLSTSSLVRVVWQASSNCGAG
jgi:transposase-like protein